MPVQSDLSGMMMFRTKPYGNIDCYVVKETAVMKEVPLTPEEVSKYAALFLERNVLGEFKEGASGFRGKRFSFDLSSVETELMGIPFWDTRKRKLNLPSIMAFLTEHVGEQLSLAYRVTGRRHELTVSKTS